MENLSSFLALISIFLFPYLWLRVRNARRPPGPYRWPLFGNAFQMPTSRQWEKFTEWAKTYGDITYLEVLGKPIAVINSHELAIELLDKRSSIYSSRPQMVMAGELCNLRALFSMAPYGTEWREQRKLVSSALTKTRTQDYHVLQEAQARKFVLAILDRPEHLFSEIKLRIGSIITRVSYGYYPASAADQLLTIPLNAIDTADAVVASGVWLVDIVPLLRLLPSWLPGTSFLNTAKQVAENWEQASWMPYRWCVDNLPSGRSLTPNMCSTILSEGSEPTIVDETRIVKALVAVFAGGLHTSMGTILWIFVCLLRHPEVQRKAQQEIDRIIGKDQLPTIRDRERLPYVQSVIAEAMRYRPIMPLSLPHATTQDDVYEDKFHIPKDTLIFPNVWHMFHDPSVYAQPETFNPDRFGYSEQEMRKIPDTLFGFGRRSCPGNHLAEASVFAFITAVLATCNILPQKDGRGRDILPDDTTTPGVISFPREFKCKLELRSPNAMELLEQVGSEF